MKQTLAMTLGGVVAAYLCLLAGIYVACTASSSVMPELSELDRLIFGLKSPSRIERLLEADGERIEGGASMRPAFKAESAGWKEITERLTEHEMTLVLLEREGEREGLLAWVRSGGSRDAYEKDDYSLPEDAVVPQITPKYRLPYSSNRLRIRTLIADRCVTCHGEGGRHDTARFIPLDRYELLAPRLQPESSDWVRPWVVATLVALTPLAAVCGFANWHSRQPYSTRLSLLALTFGATALSMACWLPGRLHTWQAPVIVACVFVATLGIVMETFTTFIELLINPPAEARQEL